MLREPRRLKVHLTACDLLGEQTVELKERAVNTKQSLQAGGFSPVAGIFQRQLPRDEVEDVDRDAQLEGVEARDERRDIVAQEIRNRLDQLGGGRFVLHVNLLEEQVAATDRFPFPRRGDRSWRAPSNERAARENAASCRRTSRPSATSPSPRRISPAPDRPGGRPVRSRRTAPHACQSRRPA